MDWRASGSDIHAVSSNRAWAFRRLLDRSATAQKRLVGMRILLQDQASFGRNNSDQRSSLLQ